MFYVYVLQSVLHGRFYIGFTTNIENRLVTHNAGGNVSTKAGRPWKMIYHEAYLLKEDALGREKFLKNGSGHRFLKNQMKYYLALVKSNLDSKPAEA